MATARYALLVKFASELEGLSSKLNQDRSVEMRQVFHSRGTRFLLRTAGAASLGIYRHRERVDATTLAALDQQRRAEYLSDFWSKSAVKRNPSLSLVWQKMTFAPT